MRRLWAPKYYCFEKGKAGVKDEVPREIATLGYGRLCLNLCLWDKAFLKMLISGLHLTSSYSVTPHDSFCLCFEQAGMLLCV